MGRPRTPCLAVVVAAAVLLLVALRGRLRVVTGRSMAPTLAPGDRVLLLPPAVGRPGRGDVVVVRDPRDGRETVKRVLAVGGDPTGDDVVPPGHLFVVGDAPARSTDSRTFGPVPTSLVRGRVVARVRRGRLSRVARR